MSFQTVSREAFSLYLLADALPLSLCPVCVFQSAEFFEMLEKMQVSILSVGVGGWGKAQVGVPQRPQDTTPGETPRAKPRSLEGGQRREHAQF